jgi:outer membrane protein OmpA-like peptidoglycan-associated protein
MTGTPIEGAERGRLNSLIAMANTVADRPDSYVAHHDDHTLPWALLVVGVAGLFVGGLAGFVLGRQGRSPSAAPVVTAGRPVEFSLAELLTIPPAVEVAEPGESTAPSATNTTTPTTAPSTSTTNPPPSSTTAPTTTAASAPTVPGPPPPFAPYLAAQIAGKANFALSDGRAIVLTGKMASQAMIDEWAAYVDEAFDLPVVNELSIDPAAGAAVGFISFPGTCFFDEGSTSVGPNCSGQILAIARALLVDPDAKVSVAGNSDKVGSTPARIAEISRLRAESGRDVLVLSGVPLERITVLPRGANDPAGDDATVEGRARNRRLDIMIDNFQP